MSNFETWGEPAPRVSIQLDHFAQESHRAQNALVRKAARALGHMQQASPALDAEQALALVRKHIDQDTRPPDVKGSAFQAAYGDAVDAVRWLMVGNPLEGVPELTFKQAATRVQDYIGKQAIAI